MTIWQTVLNGFAVEAVRGLQYLTQVIAALVTVAAVCVTFYLRARFVSPSGRVILNREVRDATGARAVPGCSEPFDAPARDARDPFSFYRILPIIVGGAFALGAVRFLLSGSWANGSFLIAVVFITMGFVVWMRMTAAMRSAIALAGTSANPNQSAQWESTLAGGAQIRFNGTGTAGSQSTLDLDRSAIQTANAMLQAGGDIEAVCRALDPQYANRGALEKLLLRTAIEAAVKAEGAAR